MVCESGVSCHQLQVLQEIGEYTFLFGAQNLRPEFSVRITCQEVAKVHFSDLDMPSSEALIYVMQRWKKRTFWMEGTELRKR
jgi:hypothetical protein